MANIKNRYEKAYIYGLIDPRNNRIRYVGWATNLTKRLVHHLCPSNLRTKTHKNNWIKQLLSLGLKPEIYLLEEINILDFQKKETWWISFVGRKNLTNETDGGEGSVGFFHSKETKNKMSMIQKERFLKEKSSFFGKKHSEESKRNMSIGHRGKPRLKERPPISEETRKKMIESGKTKIFSEEHRKNISKANSGIGNSHTTKKEVVIKIKKLLDNNLSQCKISKELGVGRPVVKKVLNGYYDKLYNLGGGNNVFLG